MTLKRRLGSLDPFFQTHNWDFRMGRPVASEAFGKALLRYGTWDEYHFILRGRDAIKIFRGQVEEAIEGTELRRRVRVTEHSELPGLLLQGGFDVFHQGDFTSVMPGLSAIRQRPEIKNFSITGVTHSLDGSIMQTRFLQLALSGLTSSDAIICTSSAAQLLVINKFNEVIKLLNAATNADLRTPEIRTPIIPLGIEESLFFDTNSADTKAAARAFFNIPSKSIVALSVGRLSRDTKCDWSPILELLARLIGEDLLPNFILIIAGGGDQEEIKSLQDLIDNLALKEKVIIFSNFPATVKSTLYKASDIYISPIDNYQETFGINVVEAMAAGLPVIASDFDGYRDTIEHSQSGFLIPTISSTNLPEFLDIGLHLFQTNMSRHYLSQMVSLDLEKFTVALLALHSNIGLRQKMGGVGKHNARRYRWIEIIKEYEALWLDLLMERKSKGKNSKHIKGTMLSELLSGDGIKSYAHYNSNLLEKNTILTLTTCGEEILSSKIKLTRYNSLDSVYSRELENLILLHLQHGSISISDLSVALSTHTLARKGDLHFHILWLIKHGAIKIDI